jgi:hypothetical protein
MGVLGTMSADDAAARAASLAVEWDEGNGGRGAVGALHLITSVAQPWPMADGSYLSRLDPAAITTYVEAARRHGVQLILDLQIGMADPLAEVQRLGPFLAEPSVHVALDPEFAMHRKGGAPGENIGSPDASDVNRVAHYLGDLVAAHALPTKRLVLHQFRDDMLTGTGNFEDVQGVLRTVDMDGWGGQGVRLDNYRAYSLAPYAQRPAIKLFYQWDEPLLGITQLLALARVPDLVIYQ